MTEASLSDWLHTLERLHPKEIDLGLERVGIVAERLGLLECVPTTITVAGTNGKGSVVALVSQGLRSAGLHTGVYTSPHLVRFNERLEIDGEAITDAELVSVFAEIEDARGDVSLTYFEFATLAALLWFRRSKVDVQVLEVGLGGRLDAVNLIDATVAVITSIGLDHTDWLGPDRDAIGREKAAIARAGRPCVIAESDPPRGLLEVLSDIGARALFLGQDWHVNDRQFTSALNKSLPLPQPAGLLPSNVGAALQALECLSLVNLSAGLLSDLQAVRLPGRLQRIMVGHVDVVLDVAHNTEAVEKLMQFVEQHPVPGVTRAIFGVMGDKPMRDMIARCAGRVDEWYIATLPEIPRSATSEQLLSLLTQEEVAAVGEVPSLWRTLLDRSQPGDRVLVFGSFHVVGQVSGSVAVAA